MPSSSGTRARIEQEVLALKDRRARVWRRKLWQWAQANPKSTLHKRFNWNVKEAAEEAWDMRAGEIIRSVQMMIQYVDRPLPTPTPRLVAEMKARQSSYVDITERKDDEGFADNTMAEELNRIKSATRRGMSLALYFRRVPAFRRQAKKIVDDETR
jgi:hypothetical protein